MNKPIQVTSNREAEIPSTRLVGDKISCAPLNAKTPKISEPEKFLPELPQGLAVLDSSPAAIATRPLKNFQTFISQYEADVQKQPVLTKV